MWGFEKIVLKYRYTTETVWRANFFLCYFQMYIGSEFSHLELMVCVYFCFLFCLTVSSFKNTDQIAVLNLVSSQNLLCGITSVKEWHDLSVRYTGYILIMKAWLLGDLFSIYGQSNGSLYFNGSWISFCLYFG